MSDFQFKVNLKGAFLKIKRAKSAMLKVPQAMNRAGLFFIGDIQEEYYSGRKGDDTGLNVRSGRLRDSWFPNVMVQSNDTVLRVITDVKYAAIHEFSSFDKNPEMNIPARTDVVNDWETKGLDLIKDEIRKVMVV